MSTEDDVAHQYLSFFVAGEEYAVGILQVREIIEYSPVTRVPSMPAAIRGVTNLRGKVVPVIDLSVRFGFGESQLSKWTCIVMVEADLDGELGIVGLLADSVSQVVDLPPQEIEPPPSFGTHVRVDFIRGMGKVGKKFVPILAFERLLSSADLLAAMATPLAEVGEPAKVEAPGS